MQAIIFDMDGVLCATVEYHYLSWKTLAEEYDLPFSRAANEKLLGLTRRRSLEIILDGQTRPEAQIKAMLARKNDLYLQHVAQMSPADLLPGVRPLLEQAAAAGLGVGVASASRNTRVVLEKLGIAGLVGAVVDGNTLKRSKPHPEAFLRAAEALRAAPWQCLAIEDSAAGLQAALAAGMCVIGVGPPERLQAAWAVSRTLANVNLSGLEATFRCWQQEQGLTKLKGETSDE
jgi:beta-phosphoglucomutase